jgi:hypothetical protein
VSLGGAHPAEVLRCSTLLVPVGKVLELSSLLHVALVVGFLLGDLGLSDLLVLRGAQSRGDVRFGSDLADLQVLLGAGTVVVLVSLGGEQIQVEDAVGQRDVLVGSRGLLVLDGFDSSGNSPVVARWSKCGGRSDKGSGDEGGILHFRDGTRTLKVKCVREGEISKFAEQNVSSFFRFFETDSGITCLSDRKLLSSKRFICGPSTQQS